ncbi:MAG: hypothetical protein Q4E07_00060 [Eubacteriales bacterium]|nr:hypothetical protein [Eubacteriales bacterium]
MKLIDFDKHFADFWVEYLHSHMDDYEYLDQFENDMGHIYEVFLETPADWIDNKKPCEYFDSFSNPEELVKTISDYIREDIPLPEMLLSRIASLEKATEEQLLKLLSSDHSMHERMVAVTLLREIGSDKPLKTYIDWIVKGEARELIDNALESLEQFAESLESELLTALPKAQDDGKQALLSLLSRIGQSEEVYSALLDLFERLPKHRAELSSYIGRLGDDRALPVLMDAAADENTGYLDYIEIRNAIEELGGEAPKRSFDESDPAYSIFKDEA